MVQENNEQRNTTERGSVAALWPDGEALPVLDAALDVFMILQIGNNAVNDVSTLSDALATKNPGETVAVHIYRGSQQLTINVKLGELQAGG